MSVRGRLLSLPPPPLPLSLPREFMPPLSRLSNPAHRFKFLPSHSEKRIGGGGDGYYRREIITVRGKSYVSRLPKYWPPTPLSARWVCTPRLCWGGGGGRTHSPGGEGGGESIFWKTIDIGLPYYSNNLSTVIILKGVVRLSWKGFLSFTQLDTNFYNFIGVFIISFCNTLQMR